MYAWYVIASPVASLWLSRFGHLKMTFKGRSVSVTLAHPDYLRLISSPRVRTELCESQPLSLRHFPPLPRCAGSVSSHPGANNRHHQDNDTHYISNFSVIQNTQLGDFLSVGVLVNMRPLMALEPFCSFPQNEAVPSWHYGKQQSVCCVLVKSVTYEEKWANAQLCWRHTMFSFFYT